MFRGKTSLVNPNPPAIEHDLVEPPPFSSMIFPDVHLKSSLGSGISMDFPGFPRLNGPGFAEDDVNPLRFIGHLDGSQESPRWFLLRHPTASYYILARDMLIVVETSCFKTQLFNDVCWAFWDSLRYRIWNFDQPWPQDNNRYTLHIVRLFQGKFVAQCWKIQNEGCCDVLSLGLREDSPEHGISRMGHDSGQIIAASQRGHRKFHYIYIYFYNFLYYLIMLIYESSHLNWLLLIWEL